MFGDGFIQAYDTREGIASRFFVGTESPLGVFAFLRILANSLGREGFFKKHFLSLCTAQRHL
jgi:hypothetical protein